MANLPPAYLSGCQAAFSKLGFDTSANDRLIAALGMVNPTAAAVGSTMTAPDGYGLGSGMRTGVSSMGGRMVGEHGGELLGRILAGLLKKDPALFSQIGKHVGAVGGGALGADVGNSWARQNAMEDMYKKRTSSPTSF